MGLTTTNYKEVCDSKYEKKLEYLDPEKHRQNIYKIFLTDYDLLPDFSPIDQNSD